MPTCACCRRRKTDAQRGTSSQRIMRRWSFATMLVWSLLRIVWVAIYTSRGSPAMSAGKRRGVHDPSGRGEFYLLCANRILRLRPRAFVLENVPAFAKAMQGKLLARLLAMLSEGGYDVSHAVLNALDFRCPQRRRRLFIVGRLGSWACPCCFPKAHRAGLIGYSA